MIKPSLHISFFSSIHMLRRLSPIILASQFSSQLKLTGKNENSVVEAKEPYPGRATRLTNKAAVHTLPANSFRKLHPKRVCKMCVQIAYHKSNLHSENIFRKANVCNLLRIFAFIYRRQIHLDFHFMAPISNKFVYQSWLSESKMRKRPKHSKY